MSKPAISGLPQNIFLSSAQLLVGGVGGVDAGLVSAVKVSLKEDTKEVKTDQLGTMPANHFNVGMLAHGELTFDEFTPSQLKKAFPQAQLVNSGGVTKLSFGKPIGSDYFSLAQSLLFIPTSDDVAYAGRHLLLNKVAFMGDASIDYGPEKKITIKAKFQCYPDLTKPSGEWIGYFGDPSAGSLVHAAVAAAVAGVNTGNGTVSNEAANDNFTKTETWTLTCIHASVGGGLFSVVGSVTGARGIATVGSSYASNSITPANSEILLKINAGGTDFVIGDSFTIAATQANFV